MGINTSYLDTGATLPDIIDGLNTGTGGYLMGFFLFAIFIMIFISLKTRTETKTSLLTSGTITTLLAIFMWWGGWIGYGIIFIPLAAIFAGLVMHAFD